jgi:hypothetical protein
MGSASWFGGGWLHARDSRGGGGGGGVVLGSRHAGKMHSGRAHVAVSVSGFWGQLRTVCARGPKHKGLTGGPRLAELGRRVRSGN